MSSWGFGANPPSHDGCTTATTFTLNLVTGTLGAGILSLPWATAGASLLPALGLTLTAMLLNAGTCTILVLAAERFQVFSIGALMEKLPGRWGKCARLLCDWVVIVSVVICLTSYLIVIADSLEPYLDFFPREMLVAIGAMMVLPLCALEPQHLAFSSGLCIAANIYLFALLAITSVNDATKNMSFCMVGSGRGLLSMFNAVMQAAIVQMCILPMYEQLEKRSPRRFALCAVTGFGFVTLLFGAFSSLAYIKYGPQVSDNVLQDLPHNFAGSIARVGMLAAVAGVYPVMLLSLTAPSSVAEETSATLIQAESAPPASKFTRRHAKRIAFACSLGGALLTSNLGRINVVNGALQVAGLVAVAPSVTGLCLLGWTSAAWQAVMYALLCSGLAAAAGGLILTDNFVGDVVSSCAWLAAD